MTDYREKDTVVVSDGGERGTGLGMIAGILLVIVLLLAVWYITLGRGRGTTETNSGGNSQPVPSVQAPAASPAAS